MAIKIKNIDTKSTMAKHRMYFGPGSSASSVSNAVIYPVICPVKGTVTKIVTTNITGYSACAGAALHIVVTNQGRASACINNTITGTCAGIAAYAVSVACATAVVPVSANTVFTINISACEVAGHVSGYLEVQIAKDQK